MIEIPFDRVGHFARIQVGLPDGSSARFLVDTGVGITIVSTALVRRCGLTPSGDTYTGHRMSGQAVEVPWWNYPRWSCVAPIRPPIPAVPPSFPDSAASPT